MFKQHSTKAIPRKTLQSHCFHFRAIPRGGRLGGDLIEAMAGGLLDRDKRVLRREGPGAPAARQLRRVHRDVGAAYRRGVAAHRAASRGPAPKRRHRGAGTTSRQIRADLPVEADTLGKGRRPVADDA